MPALSRFLRRVPAWVWPALVLLLAAVLRLVDLGRAPSLVFDELYYVRDAVSQLAHGYPTTWPDSEHAFGGERARSFTDEASLAVHPPLGKWMIGLGMLAFGGGADAAVGTAGIDTAWGWRIAVAVAGVITVALTMRITKLLTGSLATATLAGLFLAIDGVHVVLSRVSLLDGFLTLFVTLGALFMVRDHLALGSAWRAFARSRLAGHSPLQAQDPPGHAPLPASGAESAVSPVVWRRPWLLAAGLAFGLAAGVKWSGLFALAAFLLLTVFRDMIVRARTHGLGRVLSGTALQILATGAIALPAALVAYLATWLGWILTPGGWGRQEGTNWFMALWKFHVDTITWHSSLVAPHPYRSDPWTWPLGLRPTAMYFEQLPGGLVSVISPIPNPVVTWAGVLALITLGALVVRAMLRVLRPGLGRGFGVVPAGTDSLKPLHGTAFRRAHWSALTASPLLAAGSFAIVGYLSGWLPWVLMSSRSSVFQFYAVVLTPFSALALALVLAWFAGPRAERTREEVQGRRIAVAILVAAALAAAAFFFPLWTGLPIDRGYWQLHLWLPGWR